MIKGMKRIVCAVLNLIPLLALASTPLEPYTAPATVQSERLNPSVICVVPIQHEDVQYLRLITPKAGVETCYPINSRHYRERGYITLITDRGLLLGWKENTGVPECGYWSAIQDLKEKLLDSFGLIRIRYADWHTESCEAQ